MTFTQLFHVADEEEGKAKIADELVKRIRAEEGREPGPVSFRVRRISSDAVLVQGRA